MREFNEKRGQITLFIIVGIVILLVIAIFIFVLKDDAEDSGATMLGDFNDVDTFLEQCIKLSAAEAGFYISEHAGYSYVPDNHITFNGVPITKTFDYMSFPKIQLLSIRQIEEHYSDKYDMELYDCIDDFRILENKGYKMTEPQIISQVEIQDERVIVQTSIIFEASLNRKTKQYDNFPEEIVPLRIGMMHDIVSFLLAEKEKKPMILPGTRIDAKVAGKDVKWHAKTPKGSGKEFYYFYDDSTTVQKYSREYSDGQRYEFVMGVKIE